MVEPNIERLEWDSVFFGYEIGKIQINSQDKIKFDFFFEQAKRYKLIYIYSDITLTDSRFKLVDSKVIFHQKINEENFENNFLLESFDTRVHDYNQIKQLALESGVYSRFFIDQNFKSNEYVRLYSKWIENAVKKINTFDVIVATKNNDIVGFTTLNRISDVLMNIGLVAVSKDFRGLGIGKGIINESILRAKESGFKEIQVVTQLENIAAMRLYTSTNFKIEKITNIYHFWNI
jgi:dTDP-4-amino-4,6-dideoxy-D-galactose acyltransferase